jgi:hypothetical protein
MTEPRLQQPNEHQESSEREPKLDPDVIQDLDPTSDVTDDVLGGKCRAGAIYSVNTE